MDPNFFSIIPPFIVLVLGYLTRKIVWSLAAGILAAGVLATQSLYSGFKLAGLRFFENLELQVLLSDGLGAAGNLLIVMFLLILGVFITLMHHSGAARAYEKFVRSGLTSKKQAEASTLLLSTALFIDDYFSSLTVGSVMRTVTDPFRVPRAKLAFLVDSMAAPLAIICPISSWVAATVGFLRDSGFASVGSKGLINASPYVAYLNIVPYILYSFAVIVGAWVIVLSGCSFGKMRRHEQIARSSGNLFGGKEAPEQRLSPRSHDRGHISDFVAMNLILVAAVLLGLAWSGGWSVGGKVGIVEAFRNSSAPHGLFFAGVWVLGLQLLWMSARRLLALRELPGLVLKGIKLMAPSVLVLLLAWTLGALLRLDLRTGEYLAEVFTGSVGFNWLPVMFFVGSAVTATCIGSSWGTAAVMFPIAVQLYMSMKGLSGGIALEAVDGLFPILGAILSGSVAGDHISPISDTTIMSSTSTGMNHADHVETQVGYALPFIVVTALSFALSGWLRTGFLWWLPYVVIVCGVPLLLFTLHRLEERRH